MSGDVALFDFMVVRAPDAVADGPAARRIVRDRGQGPGRGDEEGLLRRSDVARTVAEAVGDRGDQSIDEALGALRSTVLSRHVAVRRPLFSPLPSASSPTEPLPEVEPPPAVTLDEWEAGAHHVEHGHVYLLPDSLPRIPGWAVARLAPCLPVLAAPLTDADVAGLGARLDRALGADNDLETFVLGPDAPVERWGAAQRHVYDALYVVYVMSRWVEVDVDHLLRALQALHLLEALAIDRLVARLAGTAPAADSEDERRLAVAARLRPALREGRDPSTPPPGPQVVTAADVRVLLDAQVLVHPLFARLFHYVTPFNPIRPIGCGDLKVVRQRLTAYRLGEISYIHNVMHRERKSREHRRLEKTEELFSLTEVAAEETTRDTQATDRFEVKNEAEQVIKSSLNVTANANLSYNNKAAMITASAGAGFGYQRASEDHVTTAANFARDVVAKAVERVEQRSTRQRSTTKVFETEEKNLQEVNNIAGDGHVAGIYRWVDKEYTAQLYNYGRRVMFEFVVPEPAAFWTEARLRAVVSELDVPQPPAEPELATVTLPFTPDQVDETRYAELARSYDLSSAPVPPEIRDVALAASGDGYLRGKDVSSEHEVHAITRDVRLEGAAGYLVERVTLDGHVDFDGDRPQDEKPNRLTVLIDGQLVARIDDRRHYWWFPDDHPTPAPPEPLLLGSDTLNLALVFRFKVNNYGLVLGARLRLGDAARRAWRQKVYDLVHAAESKRVEAENAEKRSAHDADHAEYRNRLAQLAVLRVADLLRGGPEAANKAVMDEEIKKHCLSMLMRDFDADRAGDQVSTIDALGEREIQDSRSRRFDVREGPPTTADFAIDRTDVTLPAVDIVKARQKALHVQFLEQAFEWHRMSYLFYPYFWAAEQRWIELMSRTDDGDRAFAEFLRAGMCRVLLAVSEGYDGAVAHYLATGEPWNGGRRPPLIDDPLFVPLAQELAERLQDDRTGGVAEGEPWTYRVPTSLVYLHDSSTPMVDLAAEAAEAEGDGGEGGGGEETPDAPDGDVPRRRGLALRRPVSPR